MKLWTVCGVVTSRAGSRCTEHARQLTAHAKARGWDAAFGAGVVRVKEGQSGRGERDSPATNDLPITMRLAEPPAPIELARGA